MISAGQQQVVFNYNPPGYPLGLFITLGTLLLAFVTCRRSLAV